MKQLRIIYGILFIVFIILLLMGLVLVVNKLLFLNRATAGEGIIIGLKKEISHGDNDSSITYKPEVQFQTKDGEVKTFISSMSSNPPLFNIGTKVNVLYDSAEKMNAEIDSFMTLWFESFAVFFIGLIFGLISITGIHRLKSGKPMGVRYQFCLEGKEILYYFKYKKVCPICNGKLSKEKRKVDRGIGISKWDELGRNSYMYGQRYEVEYWYKCKECGKSFSIEELASRV